MESTIEIMREFRQDPQNIERWSRWLYFEEKKEDEGNGLDDFYLIKDYMVQHLNELYDGRQNTFTSKVCRELAHRLYLNKPKHEITHEELLDYSNLRTLTVLKAPRILPAGMDWSNLQYLRFYRSTIEWGHDDNPLRHARNLKKLKLEYNHSSMQVPESTVHYVETSDMFEGLELEELVWKTPHDMYSDWLPFLQSDPMTAIGNMQSLRRLYLHDVLFDDLEWLEHLQLRYLSFNLHFISPDNFDFEPLFKSASMKTLKWISIGLSGYPDSAVEWYSIREELEELAPQAEVHLWK